MTAKPWWQSKTKWAGLLLGLAQLLRASPWGGAEFAPVAEAAGVALGGFGLRDALER